MPIEVHFHSNVHGWRYSHKFAEFTMWKKNKETLCSRDRDGCSPFAKEYLAIFFAVCSCLFLFSSERSAGHLLFYTPLKTFTPTKDSRQQSHTISRGNT